MGYIKTILPSLSLTEICGATLGTWHLLPALAQFLASTTAVLVDGIDNVLGFGLGSKDDLKLVVVLLEDEAPTSGGT